MPPEGNHKRMFGLLNLAKEPKTGIKSVVQGQPVGNIVSQGYGHQTSAPFALPELLGSTTKRAGPKGKSKEAA